MKASKQKSKRSKFPLSRKVAGLLAVALLVGGFAGYASFHSGDTFANAKTGPQQLKASETYCTKTLKTKQGSADYTNCLGGWSQGYGLKKGQTCQSQPFVKQYMDAAKRNGNKATDSKVYQACVNGQSTKAADQKPASSGGGSGGSSGGSTTPASPSSSGQTAAEKKKAEAKAKAEAKKKAEAKAKQDKQDAAAAQDAASKADAPCTKANGCDLIAKYVNPFINLFSLIFGLLATGSIIVGGIQYAASSGDPQKVTDAKQRISKTLMAIAAFLFLFGFLQFLIPGGIFN